MLEKLEARKQPDHSCRLSGVTRPRHKLYKANIIIVRFSLPLLGLTTHSRFLRWICKKLIQYKVNILI